MNKFILSILSISLPFILSAQLVSNNASIVIENGASLVVEGTFENNGGTVTNNGTIDVQKDFTNTGTFTSAMNSVLILSGNSVQNLNAGNASFYNVEISNTSGGVNMTTSGATITNNLTFKSNSTNLSLGDQSLTLGANASWTKESNSGHVDATGNGQLLKTYGSLEEFEFPVGDGIEYTPLKVDLTAGTANGTIGVNLKNTSHPQLRFDPRNPNRNTSEYLSRYWSVTGSNLGSYEANLKGKYSNGDDVENGGGGESLIKGATYIADWDYSDLATNTDNDTIYGKLTSNGDFTGSNSFGKAVLSVLLGGAYDSNLQEMRTDLNGGSSGILATFALDSPYNIDTDENESAMVDPNFFDSNLDIVDWVKIELRSASDNTNILNQRSAFLTKDGSILDLDGNLVALEPILLFKNASKDAFIAIRHRNHLGIMLNSMSNLFDGSTTINFSANGVNTFGTDAQRSLDAKLMMWEGDSNQNNNIKYQGAENDVVAIQNAVIAASAFNSLGSTISNVYSPIDLNMDGLLKYQGTDNDVIIIQNAVIAASAFNSLGSTKVAQLPSF